MSVVGLSKIRKGDTKAAITRSLVLISCRFSRGIQSVVIKPNLCYYWDYSTGQTTDPVFVGALIDVLRDNISSDVDISIVESDASAMKCKHAFKFLGYHKLAQDYGVKLINLSNEKSDPVKVTAAGQTFNLMVPRIVQNAQLRVNVTKIKYSLEKIKITCALKNIFGCNPYPKKFRYHSRLDEAIVAVNKAMKFDLCLVDGNIVAGSQPRRLGLVMASKDPVAVDSAAAKIAGVRPNTVGHIRLARQEGLGDTNFVIKGEPLDYFKERYPRKDAKKKIMSQAYNLVALLKLGKRLGLE